jgi:energy-coupling factor transport system permease protein
MYISAISQTERSTKMTMSRLTQNVQIGIFLPGDSFWHRLDPRTKLLGVLCLAVTIFIRQEIADVAIEALIILVMMSSSGVGWRLWFKGLYKFRWMLAIIAVSNVLFDSYGTPVFLHGLELPITEQGIAKALLVACQILLAIILSMNLMFTTSPRDLIKAFEYFASPLNLLKVPVSDISLVLLLALRFVTLFQTELRNIVDAQKARGIDFDYGGIVSRARNYTALLVPAIMGSLRRAELLAVAMHARCFRPGAPRTELRPLVFSFRDYVVFLALGFFLLGPYFCSLNSYTNAH